MSKVLFSFVLKLLEVNKMCVNPRSILVKDYTGIHSIQVPCGKCYECLKTKQNDYMVRIYEEMMQVSKCCFVTLTYAPENVPHIMRDGKKYLTVWKDDVKAWIKRLRTNYERATGIKGIRYFLCSEYGPKTHRPHYHAIFFNMSFQDLKPALQDWRERFGYYMAKDVDYRKPIEKVARYVSKYACKGVFENPFRCSPKPSEEFSSFLERLRRELHTPYDCFPYLFQLFSLSNLSFCKGAFAEISRFDYDSYLHDESVYTPERCTAFSRYIFGRGIS